MRALATGLVLALLLGMSAVAAADQAPPRNGVIAFVSLIGDIAAVNPDGTGLTWLVQHPAEDANPEWSPDGSMLAFSSERDGDAEIYVLDVQSGRVRQLTRNRGIADSAPTWAPTGARIAFVKAGRLFVMRADGSHRRLLTHRGGQSPAWSPDGAKISFLGVRNGFYGPAIAILTISTRRVRVLRELDVVSAPKWSPDGMRIAFSQVMDAGCETDPPPPFRLLGTAAPAPCTGLVIIAVNGREGQSWFTPYAEYNYPAWSPDGRAMVLHAGKLHTFRFGSPGSFRSVGVEGATPSWQPLCGIAGTEGRDSLDGTAGRDLVCGLGGDDRIYGGKGLDRLFGAGGDDRFLARDGAFDVVGCGPGRDTVLADRRDLVGVDCERVVRR